MGWSSAGWNTGDPPLIAHYATITSLAEIDDMSPEEPWIAGDLQAEKQMGKPDHQVVFTGQLGSVLNRSVERWATSWTDSVKNRRSERQTDETFVRVDPVTQE